MARGKKHTPEKIVGLLRQIEVGVANGKTTPAACREGGITNRPTTNGARHQHKCRSFFQPSCLVVQPSHRRIPSD
jgi:hypothetical protein